MCITAPEVAQYESSIATLESETAARKAAAKEKEAELAVSNPAIFQQIQVMHTYFLQKVLILFNCCHLSAPQLSHCPYHLAQTWLERILEPLRWAVCCRWQARRTMKPSSTDLRPSRSSAGCVPRWPGRSGAPAWKPPVAAPYRSALAMTHLRSEKDLLNSKHSAIGLLH